MNPAPLLAGPAGAAPLRIGLVCPYALDTPGGVQNHVLGLASWLSSHGHQVRVLAPGRVPAELHRRYGCPDVTSVGHGWGVRYNGSVARVALPPTAGARVRRWLQHAELDLLHLHEPLTPSASLLALRHSRLPVVATFHTATPRSRSMQVAARTMAGPVARISAAVAVSEAARRVVVEHLGLDPSVIGNGFFAAGPAASDDQVTDGWRPARADAGPGPRLAFLGRLDEHRKGLDVLVRAWPAVVARWPHAQVVVAGAGTARLPAGWTSLGRVSDDERAHLLRWCDVFLAPHRGRESFGLVLLEALTAGAQVVAADLPAFVDVVSDETGPQAHLFRRGDPADLVRAIGAALADEPVDRPDRAGPGLPPLTSGAAALQADRRRRVAELCSRFDWSAVGPQVVRVYRDVVAGGTGRPAGSVAPTPGSGRRPRPGEEPARLDLSRA